MATPPSTPTASSVWVSRLKQWGIKLATLVVFGLTLGYAYDWLAPTIYSPDRAPGFRMGVLHGALMPVTLPTLLMGKDVPIYALNSTGRTYKIGYIAGINLCGLLFFGAAFWQPRKTDGKGMILP